MSGFDYFLSMASRLAPYLFLILLVFRNSLRYSLKQVAVIAAVFFTLSTLSVAVLGRLYGNQGAWVFPYTVIFILACILLAWKILKAPFWKILFLILLIENYSDIVLLFSEIIQVRLHCTFFNAGTVISIVVIRMFIFLISCPLMWLFLVREVKPVWEHETDSSVWKMLWLIPGSFYLIYRLGLISNFDALSKEIPSPLLLALVWTVGTFLSYFATLSMINAGQEKQRLQQQLQISEYQTLIRNKQAERLAESIASTRQTRHDLHHYLLSLKTYVDSGEFDKVSDSLNQFISNFEASTKTPVCAHLLTSGIVRYYMDIAEEYGIAFSSRIELPRQLSVRDEDLTVLLGNLLENAIEANIRQKPETQKFIEVKGRIQGKNGLIFQIRNSYSGEIHQAGDVYLSSKREGEGIGVTSVRTICAKYNGVCNFTHTADQFIVSVLMNMEG